MLECVGVVLCGAAATSRHYRQSLKGLLSAALRRKTRIAELSCCGFTFRRRGPAHYIGNHFRVLSKLGEGVGGEVLKVVRESTHETFAMKCIRKSSEQEDAQIHVEISCLQKLRHRHIVSLLEVIQNDQSLLILMGCAAGGRLYDRILRLGRFSEESAAHTARQLLKAVHHMHSFGVVHRDLKSENILLESEDTDANIKVADFGLAADLGFGGYRPEEPARLKTSTLISGPYVGSPICMAPEVAEPHARYGPQCDMWSVGCLAHELLSGRPPFLAGSARALFRLVRQSEGLRLNGALWAAVSPQAKDLLCQLLQRLPEQRPSAGEALDHGWCLSAGRPRLLPCLLARLAPKA